MGSSGECLEFCCYLNLILLSLCVKWYADMMSSYLYISTKPTAQTFHFDCNSEYCILIQRQIHIKTQKITSSFCTRELSCYSQPMQHILDIRNSSYGKETSWCSGGYFLFQNVNVPGKIYKIERRHPSELGL